MPTPSQTPCRPNPVPPQIYRITLRISPRLRFRYRPRVSPTFYQTSETCSPNITRMGYQRSGVRLFPARFPALPDVAEPSF